MKVRVVQALDVGKEEEEEGQKIPHPASKKEPNMCPFEFRRCSDMPLRLQMFFCFFFLWLHRDRLRSEKKCETGRGGMERRAGRRRLSHEYVAYSVDYSASCL